MTSYRTLQRVINAQPSSDGAGVRIRRVAGRDVQRQLDPFLMLDEIRSDDSADYIGGFPSHPHRGFETITYMLEGKLRHSDHMGNSGVLESGGVQWMLAGRGVIHSEMPEQADGLMHGFQMWLNLPAATKMQPPRYRDFPGDSFPLKQLSGGVVARVMVGKAALDEELVVGPLQREETEPVVMDVSAPPGGEFVWPCGGIVTVLVYVYEGRAGELEAGQMGVFAAGDLLSLPASDNGFKALVLAGKPLREPIYQYGPFVMNSVEQIEQALADYNRGELVG